MTNLENHEAGAAALSGPRTATASHTPGPWRVAPTADYRDTDINIDAGPRGQRAYICCVGRRGDDEAMANAHLIAASPAMLTAMKQAAAILGEVPSPASGMGTQEPTYRAFKILSDEIERIEAAGA